MTNILLTIIYSGINMNNVNYKNNHYCYNYYYIFTYCDIPPNAASLEEEG